MGEAKRKREQAIIAQALEAVRETLWTTIGDASERVGLGRGDTLALLLEKGMLLDGFSRTEADRFIELMEEIESRLEQTPPPAPPEPQEGPTLPPLPGVGPAAAFAAQRPEQRLGEAPIEGRYHADMVKVVQNLDQVFNGRIGGPGRETGFVLMVFPFGDRSGRCNYMSNGADRRDIVTLMREMIARFEGQPDMTGRA